jgi:hypothetical protein
VHPAVLESYLDGSLLEVLETGRGAVRSSHYLSSEELAVRELLRIRALAENNTVRRWSIAHRNGVVGRPG